MSDILRLYILRNFFNIAYKPFEYCVLPPAELSSTIFKVRHDSLNDKEGQFLL